MRAVLFGVSFIITGALVYILGSSSLLPLPLGQFLSPQHGIWQNAEPVKENFNMALNFPDLKGKATVYLDDRLVPHIVADNDEDACFIQGYLHARFRLWQMEFQTMAAAGRISEIIGEKAIHFDRGRRRLGMVYAAENMLREMEADPVSKSQVDHYTAGVNAYIASLSESRLPVEYKLLGYQPERWNNLKTALFVKLMSLTLAGFSDDLALTKAKAFFGDEQLRVLFPQVADSLSPIIPEGTLFASPTVHPEAPATADSLYLGKTELAGTLSEIEKPDPANGSNNWAVSGQRTQSGAPILCNDPHLDLSFPSIWYEMQVTTPTMNAYGVSFPGAPGVIIGFNDSIAFGFTNAGRDVLDYYAIQFKDDTKTQYRFNNEWKNSQIRIENIKVKGKPVVYDTVAYTVFGPVGYDNSFPATDQPGKNLAIRWKAHDPSNELLLWYYLDRAKNYGDYKNALQYFSSPAQNVVFASKSGDIAIWQQGEFAALWNRQGVYVMPGDDSSYMWQRFIPMDENPHILNPERGFVSSANQRPADSTYPYFIPGYYDLYRGIAVNKKLSALQQVTADDMMKMQNDNYNVFAETTRPILLKYINDSILNDAENKYLDLVRNWSLYNNINEKGATVFSLWFDNLKKQVWDDEFEKAGVALRPSAATLTEALLRDSSFAYIDNINTPAKETIADAVTNAFKQAAVTADSLAAINRLSWGPYRDPSIYHLLGETMMPFARTGLPVGGGEFIINAMKHKHGPSWRMVIELTHETSAYVVYPGGQSGNPGSPYYDSFVDKWAAGEYYKAWFMKRGEPEGNRLVWKMVFEPK
ncbi:MAG: penicillin acylase family protein [Chitinophagaceae bacterium]|nr:penicillin acylase family protein [Chitinophagaceae bacterium]